MRRFVSIAFQLCFGICHQEGPREPGRTETEWDTSSCADINIVGENTDTIHKNTNALFDASKEVGLEVNPEKTKCILMSHYQKAGQKHSIKTVNRPFEGVAKFKYLGPPLTEQNCIQEKIKSRLNSGMLATTRLRVFCLLVCSLGM
jgi:hypothetical protein